MNELCTICIDDLYLLNEELIILPCKHKFHKKCIYNNIMMNGYKCPFKCEIDILSEKILQKINNNSDNKYIEKFNKRIIIPDTIEKILNMIKWENKNENVFIAGGFALALYNNFKIPYTDIDIMCDNLNVLNFTELFLNKEYIVEVENIENNNYKDYGYYYNKNSIERVIKLKNDLNNLNMDIIKLKEVKKNRENKLTNIIYDTIDKFDISCCKIALTYQLDNNFTIYIHPDYYNNRAYLDKTDEKKRLKTLNRIEKYKMKGIKNIEIIDK